MIKNINLQYLFSYLGIIPYLILIIDKTFFNQFQINFLHNFSIYYSLIIFVFIGASNWNLTKEIPIHKVIYGFLPSLLSVFLIFFNLYSYDIFFLLILCLIIQLIIDYFIIYKPEEIRKVYYFLRIPLTLLIVFSLIIIQL